MARTLDARLVFLVNFTRTDIGGCSAVEWTALLGRFDDFLNGRMDGTGPVVHADDPSQQPAAWSPELVRRIQKRVQRHLDDVIGQRLRRETSRSQKSTGHGPFAVLQSITTLFRWEAKVGVVPRNRAGRAAVLTIRADAETAVSAMTQIILWLSEGTDAPVRRCAECDGYFVAPRVDSFCCSPRCTRRRWWKSPKGKKNLKQIYARSGWKLGARGRGQEATGGARVNFVSKKK